MSFESVRNYFKEKGMEERVAILKTSSATVELAAKALECEPKQIAKSLSFMVDRSPILVVAAGNVKMDNKKFKSRFGTRPKMIPGKSVKDLIGHDVGGVCPFMLKPEVTVYLDCSLKQNHVVYPAAGTENSLVKLTIEELQIHTEFKDWVDVGKYQ